MKSSDLASFASLVYSPDTRDVLDPPTVVTLDMDKAGGVHFLRTIIAALFLAAVTFAGISMRHAVLRQRAITKTQIQERENATRADALVESLLSAEITQVPSVLSDLDHVRKWADPLLKIKVDESADGSAEKLNFSLALLPVDNSQIDYLSGQLPICTLEQFPVVRKALLPYKDKITNMLWRLVQDEEQDVSQRFQSAAALATYTPGDERWKEVAPFIAQHLTSTITSVYVGEWLRLLQPVRHQLTDPLINIHSDRRRSEKQRETTALVLANYLQDRPDRLLNTILLADEIAEFSPLVDAALLRIRHGTADRRDPGDDAAKSISAAAGCSLETPGDGCRDATAFGARPRSLAVIQVHG